MVVSKISISPILLDNYVILSNHNFCPSSKYKGYLGYQNAFLWLSTYVFLYMVIYIPSSVLIVCPFYCLLVIDSYCVLDINTLHIFIAKISSKLYLSFFIPSCPQKFFF